NRGGQLGGGAVGDHRGEHPGSEAAAAVLRRTGCAADVLHDVPGRHATVGGGHCARSVRPWTRRNWRAPAPVEYSSDRAAADAADYDDEESSSRAPAREAQAIDRDARGYV